MWKVFLQNYFLTKTLTGCSFSDSHARVWNFEPTSDLEFRTKEIVDFILDAQASLASLGGGVVLVRFPTHMLLEVRCPVQVDSNNPTPGFWSLKSLIWNNLMGLVVDVLLSSTEASAGRSYLRHALTHLASIARSGALCQVLKERKQYFVRPQHLSQHLRIRWSGHWTIL